MITFNIDQLDSELTSITAVTDNVESVWAVCRGPVFDEVLKEVEKIVELVDGQILDWRE
jgi:hypothetical protein